MFGKGAVSFSRFSPALPLQFELAATFTRFCERHIRRSAPLKARLLGWLRRRWAVFVRALMAHLPLGPHRLEELVNSCLSLAKQMLEKNGSFYPFGAVINFDGARQSVIGDAGQGAKTPAVYQAIQSGMRDQYFKNQIVAGAIVAEVKIPAELKAEFAEGLRIAVESGNVARLVYLPYRKIFSAEQLSDPAHDPHAIGPATFQYGELIGLNVHPTIFAKQ